MPQRPWESWTPLVEEDGWRVVAWISLVEGDDQSDHANSQTCVECCSACTKYFLGLS